MSTNTITPVRPRAAATTLQRGMVGVLGALVFLALCFFHFTRHFQPDQLSPDALDMAQAARRVATGGGLSTNIIRPLVLRDVRPNADGSLPDVGHAPLYPFLAGVGMQVTGRDVAGQGGSIAALLSLACFALSLGACYLLARRLFGPDGALLACLLYALGANALTLALDPGPATLAAVLFPLLLLALTDLDVLGTDRRASLSKAAWAGMLWGMLFLTAYSSLLLLGPILLYLFLVTRRSARAAGAFLAVALLVASPSLVRSARATGNPLYNAHLAELVMHTDTYPGDTLYRSLGMTQTLPEYLADGGIGEILRKAAGNLLGYYGQLPASFGVLLLPLFLVAALSRFTNPQVNRIRYLVYVLLVLHTAGLSLYLPFGQGVPLLLMYLPFVAVIGTTFFLNLIRARGLPPFYARAAVAAWAVAACLPGIGQLFAGTNRPANAYRISDEIAQSAAQIKASPNALVASELPWEVAYRADVPAVWLPGETLEFRAVEERLGRPVAGITMTPALERLYDSDALAAPWRSTYARLDSLFITASLLDPQAQQDLLRRASRQAARLYAPEIAGVLAGFTVLPPVPEAGGGRYSIFWVRRAGAGQATAR